MKDQINKENYEMIFFQLIEGEYSAEEEARILKSIEQDNFLSFEWGNWKKAKLTDDDTAYFQENFGEFFAGIKNEAAIYANVTPPLEKEEKSKFRIIPFLFITGSAAACLLIAFFFFNNSDNKDGLSPIAKETTSESVDIIETPIDLLDKQEEQEKAVATLDEIDAISKSIDKPIILDSQPEDDIVLEEYTAPIEAPLIPVTKETKVDVELETKEEAPFERIAKATEVKELLNNIDTSFKRTNTIAKAKPSRKLKFTVQKEKLPPQILVTSMAQLSDMNIDMTSLLEDQKVFVVRNMDGLFLRLEKDGGEIYIALR